MPHLLLLLLLLLLPAPLSAQTHLAVLEIKIAQQPNTKPIDPFSARTLTDDLRKLALDLNAYNVITKENIETLLPPGTTLEDCGKTTCEVDIGRQLGATYIITAEIGRLGAALELTIRLYDTKSGALLQQLNLSAPDIPQLRAHIKRDGPTLFSTLATRQLTASDLDTLLYLTLSPPTATLTLDGDPIITSQQRQQDDGYLIPIAPNTKHTLKASAPGHHSTQEELLVPPGGIGTLHINLPALPKTTDTTCDPRAPTCRADLFVYTTPPGAQLYIDGALYTTERGAPTTEPTNNPNIGALRLTLPPGPHHIEARLKHHKPASAQITLKLGDFNKTLQQTPITLTPDYGALTISTPTPGATIELDGEPVSQRSPYTLTRAELRAYKLTIKAPNHLPHQQLIIPKRGAPLTLNIPLTPNYSHLTLTPRESDSGDPISGAKLTLDQDPDTPQTTPTHHTHLLTNLKSGPHELKLTHPHYEPTTITYEVPPGDQHITLPITLKPRYALLSLTNAQGIQATAHLANGDTIGDLPLQRARVPIGTIEIRIQPKNAERYTPLDLRAALKTKEHKDFGNIHLKERLGTLTITSTPSGATITIDGATLPDTTPHRTQLHQGQHTIQLKLNQHDPYTKTLHITQDTQHELHGNLGQNPTLEISCDPPSATVWINGLPRGKSPATHSARPGPWQAHCALGDAQSPPLRLTLNQGDRAERHLTINPDHINTLRARRSALRTTAWALLSAAGATLLGAGALWLGPQDTASANRDLAYRSYLEATPATDDLRRSALLSADRDAAFWHNTTLTTLSVSGGLALIGGGLLLLAPDLTPDPAPPARQRLRAHQDAALRALEP